MFRVFLFKSNLFVFEYKYMCVCEVDGRFFGEKEIFFFRSSGEGNYFHRFFISHVFQIFTLFVIFTIFFCTRHLYLKCTSFYTANSYVTYAHVAVHTTCDFYFASFNRTRNYVTGILQASQAIRIKING